MIARRSGPDRLTGVDAARGLALLGMAAAHLHATTRPDGSATPLGDLVAGRSSALFAVLAGVGIALGSRRLVAARADRPPGEFAAAATGLVVRAVLVGLLGLALETVLDAPPAVILAQYGLLFLVAVPLLRVRRPGVLFGAAAVWCAGSPVLSHVLRADLPYAGPPSWSTPPSFAMPPGELFTTLALTGYYPVLTWITYLLVGLGVGRLDLARRSTARWLAGAGAGLAVLALGTAALVRPAGVDPVAFATQRAGVTPPGEWSWLLSAGRHTGTPFDLAHTTGVALLLIGVCLLLGRGLGVLAAAGAAPLTLYTAHVVAGGLWHPFGTPAFVLQAVLAVAAGLLLRAAGRRGPLEHGVAAASGAASGWVRNRRTASPAPRGAGRSAGPGAG